MNGLVKRILVFPKDTGRGGEGMILFVWSLIVSAVNYARHQRLSDVIEEFLRETPNRRGSIMLRRICGEMLKMASAPALSSMDSSVLYRAEGIEVHRNSAIATLSSRSWIVLERGGKSAEASHIPSDVERGIYFTASMFRPQESREEDTFPVVQIESVCVPVAWRSDDKVVEVLLLSSSKAFKDVALHWAQGNLAYKNSFRVDSLEIVELNSEFGELLRGQRQSPASLDGERSCVKDILAAKNVWNSLGSAVPALTLDGESEESSAISTPLSDYLKMDSFNFSSRLTELTVETTEPAEEKPVEDELSPLPPVFSQTLDLRPGRVGPRPRRYSMFSSIEKVEDAPSSHNRERRRSLSPVSMTELGFPTASDAMTSWGIRRMSSVRGARSRPRKVSQQSVSLATATNSPAKPPNVLVYAGGADCSQLISLVERCMPVDSYAVYPVSLDHLVKGPWEECAACVVILDTDSLTEQGWSRLEEYFRKGGRCLFLCQNQLLASLTDCRSSRKRISLLKLAFSHEASGNTTLGKDFEQFMKRVTKQLKNPRVLEQFHAKDLVGGHSYTISVVREEGTPLVLYVKNTRRSAGALFTDSTLESILVEGSTVVYQALEQLGMPVTEARGRMELTPGYLLTNPKHGVSSVGWLNVGSLAGGVNIRFCRSPRDEVVSERSLPVVVCGNLHHLFDSKSYFNNLRASTHGKSVLFVPVAGSTMDIAQTLAGCPECDELVVVARYQTQGQGRGGNRWLSPAGCAMFSFPFKLSLRSRLGRSPGFIQHLMALAIVDGISRIPGFQEFALRLKWPNDIYFSRSHKLGGVLVNCTTQGNDLRCVIGCGLNVSNSRPTVCLNDLLPGDLPRLSVERVISVGMSRFEELVHVFQSDGYDRILPIYYDYWLHGREEVLLEDRNERVQIRGLDSHGYLEVRSRQSGHVFSVHPDGNTFDMMRNLIRVKD